MNGTEGRFTTLEILTIFILTIFFFMGCTAARQPTLESAPPSFAPGQATSPQIEASPSHGWIGEAIGKIKAAVAAKKERSVDNDSKNISESKFEA